VFLAIPVQEHDAAHPGKKSPVFEAQFTFPGGVTSLKYNNIVINYLNPPLSLPVQSIKQID
jgi:hypothetical protein